MLKTLVLLTALLTTPAWAAEEPPVATVTITVELAEKMVQMRVSQQQEIDQLRYEIYEYQMLLYAARTRMCASYTPLKETTQ